MTRGSGSTYFRGFMYEGAQNMLLTLWPVSATVATDLMQDLYGRLLRGERSKTSTKCREWLVRRREEKVELDAARLARAFVASFRRDSPPWQSPSSHRLMYLSERNWHTSSSF